jgi:hypothetical protein
MSNTMRMRFRKQTQIGVAPGQRVTCLVHKPHPGDRAKGPIMVARVHGRVVAGVEVAGWSDERVARLATLMSGTSGRVVSGEYGAMEVRYPQVPRILGEEEEGSSTTSVVRSRERSSR